MIRRIRGGRDQTSKVKNGGCDLASSSTGTLPAATIPIASATANRRSPGRRPRRGIRGRGNQSCDISTTTRHHTSPQKIKVMTICIGGSNKTTQVEFSIMEQIEPPINIFYYYE